MINEIKNWFRKKILKREYFIGADFSPYGDYSAIVLVLVDHKTGKFNVVSNYSDKGMGYREFADRVRILAKEYHVLGPLMDNPYGF